MRSFVILAIFLSGAAFPAFAQDRAADLTAHTANVVSDGAGLTFPSNASAADIVAGFLADEGVDAATLASLVQTAAIPGLRGVTHYRFVQEVDGLAVYGTYVKAAIDADGRLIHLIENLADTSGGARPASVGPRAALDAALNRVHPDAAVDLSEKGRDGNAARFRGGDFFWTDPTATRVVIVMNNGSLHEGFLVETWTDEDNQLHHSLVGGQGNVLGVERRTFNDSYNVFTNDPVKTPQAVVLGPGAGNAESPNGWLFGGVQTTVDIAGNNVNAYLDTDANNAPDGGGSLVADGNFVTAANLGAEPETAANQAVAVQNLFYLNNVLHDKLYAHGFVESAGNFQENNFGNGGNDSDSVNAEAQDGSGLNNANFATPSDGSNPRMQMFVWTTDSPKRDGDVDSDIVYHEYGHGLTWRMIGNMSGPMSGAIGEGMSDVLAILINNDDRLAEYSTNDPIGIRSAPYTNYPRTYGDFGGSSVHFDGEIYAAIGWRMGELYDDAGVARDTLFDHIVQGMNFTPSGPSFEDMRDGILSAANGTGDECLIWEAFADYGVGVGASGSVKGGGPFGGGKVTVKESFDLPISCLGNQQPAANAGPNQTITTVPSLVNLDGSGSSDPEDGTNLTYAWTLTDKPGDSEATLSDPNAVSPSFTADLEGTYTAQLVVTDTEGLSSDADSVTIQASDGLIVPSVTGCAPGSGSNGQRMTVIVSGGNFQSGATVSFGTRVAVQNVSFVNDTTLSIQIRVHNRAASGPRRVTVTNPNGQSGFMDNCFSVN